VTFDDALLRKGSPRVLRHLAITDVSSVDRGAGRGVKVMLAKRHDRNEERVTKMGKIVCPHCGGSGKIKAGDDGDEDDVGKRFTAVEKTHESIIADIQKRNPAMSYDAARQASFNTAEYSKLVADERKHRLGY
jgi:hypothetical protein